MASQNVEITPRGAAAESSSGCSCCSPGAGDAAAEAPSNVVVGAGTAVYQVTGMTCGHCVSAVREEVGALDGVTGVDVDLVAGGTSTLTVTSSVPVAIDAVTAAVDEAGYRLVERS